LYGALQKTMADKEDLETRVSSLEARLALLEQSLESKRPA
jgi:BMFP domain-containing protein YqiC